MFDPLPSLPRGSQCVNRHTPVVRTSPTLRGQAGRRLLSVQLTSWSATDPNSAPSAVNDANAILNLFGRDDP